MTSAIQEATVDVYSGKDDHILRRLGLSLAIEPPAIAGGTVTSANVDLTITLSEVNEAQTISAPSDAKPISDLLSRFGLSGLGSLGSSGGSVGGGGPAPAYLDCIQDATTSEEVKKCAEEL